MISRSGTPEGPNHPQNFFQSLAFVVTGGDHGNFHENLVTGIDSALKLCHPQPCLALCIP
jgi:hypothetical protein